MNWLFPGFLGAALAIGLPIALHFLRHKPKTIIRFPSLRFLGETAMRDTRRHRLLRLLTLLLRCLIILLLVGAFARPFWAANGDESRQVMIIALDNSMSMQAGDRWTTAQQWALDQLATLRPGDRAGLLLMHPTPTWLAPLNDDLGSVRTTLRQQPPGFAATHYLPALRMAGETLMAQPSHTRTLLWMADEQRLGWIGTPWEQRLPAGVEVRFAPPAAMPEKQATLRSVQWSGAGELELQVRLFAPEKQTRHLRVQAGEKVIAERDLALTRDGANRFTIKLPPHFTPEPLRVSLDPDDLPADDVAWVVPPAGKAKSVLLSPGADETNFLSHALRSTARLAEDDALEPIAMPDGEWPSGKVAIVQSADFFRAPQVTRLEQFLAHGGALWLFADDSTEETAWLQAHGITSTARPVEDAPEHLRDWDFEHPVLQAFHGESLLPLMEVEFHGGQSLSGAGLTSIANWPDGTAAVAEAKVGAGRVLLCGFLPTRTATNWLVLPSFVPLVNQAVRWLSAAGEARQDYRVGDTLPLPDIDGTWRALDSPRPEPARKIHGSVRPSAPGVYEFTSGDMRQLFAVNVPVAESDLMPWPDADQLARLQAPDSAAQTPVANAAPPVSDAVAEARQRWWWWLLAIGGLALLGELALANRTAM